MFYDLVLLCKRNSYFQSVGFLACRVIMFLSRRVNSVQRGQAKCRVLHIFFFLKILFIFRQRGREGEREGNINVWLPLTCPLLGTWPATQACALNGNRTCDPLVCRPTLNPLSHTSLVTSQTFIFYYLDGWEHNSNIFVSGQKKL